MSDTYIIEVGSQPAGIIVRAPGGYRFSALVLGVVRSTPFQTRMRAPSQAPAQSAE